MSIDMKKRRRQVAWICFDPFLSESQLVTAIKILEQNHQVDSVSNMIAYITRICSEFGIDDGVRKQLYSQFHDMMAKDTDLLIDPLTLLQEQEELKSPPAKIIEDAPVFVFNPSNPIEVFATEPTPPPPLAEPSAPVKDIPIYALVFAHFVDYLLVYMPDQNEFFDTLKDLSKDKKLVDNKMAVQLSLWLNNTGSFEWSENLPEKTLSEIVHLIYTAFCDILGPIQTDDAFHKSLAKCEQLPEARQFPPSKFL